MTPKEFCKKHYACSDGAEFAMRHETMIAVWDNCPKVDWMIWIMDRLEIKMDDKKARLFACWCVQETPLADGRKVWDLLTDERSRNAVNVALRFARDESNQVELDAARAAAWDAAWDAARAAARAAAWAAAGDAARAAAWAAAGDVQAIKFREFFANPFVE